MPRGMNLRMRRILAVTVFSAVAVISVATSPARVGLQDCRGSSIVVLSGANPSAQSHFTFDLSAEGNPGGNAGMLNAFANLEATLCDANRDAGCVYVPHPDGGSLELILDDGGTTALELIGSQVPLFTGCPVGSACSDGLALRYTLPQDFQGEVGVRLNACGTVTVGGQNPPRGTTFTVTTP